MQAQYRDGRPYVDDMRAHYEAGKMNEIEAFIWSETRIPEELNDLENDPHEINNLANNSNFSKELKEHRKLLENWIKGTDDKGQYPETNETLKGALQQWNEKAINPEYEKARMNLSIKENNVPIIVR